MPGGLGDSSKIFIGSSVCDDLPKGGPPVKFILRLPKPNAASDLAQLTPNECDLLGMLVPDFMTRMYDRTHGRRPPSRGLLQPNGLTAAQAMVDAYGVAYAPRPAIAPHAAPCSKNDRFCKRNGERATTPLSCRETLLRNVPV